MTELSFNQHANQVTNNINVNSLHQNKAEVDYGSDYEEKRVTIDDDLPVIYKPKSYSIPDLIDESYEGSRHQHPALKFSISNSTTDTSAFLQKFFPKEKSVTCSPLVLRRNKISKEPSPKTWAKNELSRDRGKTYPHYSSDEEDTTTKVSTNKRRSLSQGAYDAKWLNFWRKINILPKLNKMKKKRKKSKISQPSFDDLPPIRCSVSANNILDTDTEKNNNSQCNTTKDNEHIFSSTTKSYKPTEQSLKDIDTKNKTRNNVKLKRFGSLPIL